MKSTKAILLGLTILVVLIFLLSFALGLRPTFLFWTLLYPLLISAIHIVSAQALFIETKRRREERNEVFMSLDPLFWGMTGLAFGLLGILAFRLLNDHFNIRQPNPVEQDRYTTRG